MVFDQKASRLLIIAEVGSVHDGSFGNAIKLIELARELGADAVKFQTHNAEAETLKDAPAPPYFKGEPRFEYFVRTGFSLNQWKAIKAACDANEIEFISSPFSIEAVQLLEDVGVARYKVPSGEVTNIPMLDAIARTGKQVILSSGMSNWAELDAAVTAVRKQHNDLLVMQCTSAYPTPGVQVGLNVISEMKRRWGAPIGFSDHTLDNHAAFAAVALGATALEKHLTFSRRMYGSDAANAAEPEQFADLVKGVRAIETMLANPVDKNDLASLKAMKGIFEKSVVSATSIEEGAVLTAAMLTVKKPGTGIPAAQLQELVGRRARHAIPADRLIKPDDLVS